MRMMQEKLETYSVNDPASMQMLDGNDHLICKKRKIFIVQLDLPDYFVKIEFHELHDEINFIKIHQRTLWSVCIFQCYYL